MCSKIVLCASFTLVALAGTSIANEVQTTPLQTQNIENAVFEGDPMSMLVKTKADNEQKSWTLLGEAPTSFGLKLFLEKFPEGNYANEAKRRLATVMADEAAISDASSPEAKAEEVPEVKIVTVSARANVTPKNRVVVFDVPLFHGESHIKGKTLQELIEGSPLFPPIEELPEEYWKNQTCASCHTWTKVNLCEQAGFYLRADGKASLTKKHPYGGTFKENLKDWATGDCQ